MLVAPAEMGIEPRIMDVFGEIDEIYVDLEANVYQ